MKFSQKKYLRIGDFEKQPFWNFFLLHLYENQSQIMYAIEWMGLNFDVFTGFQKIPCSV